MSAPLNPKRTVADLKELRKLTGDENGAQRVAFTPTWVKAREWLKKKLSEKNIFFCEKRFKQFCFQLDTNAKIFFSINIFYVRLDSLAADSQCRSDLFR